MPAIAALRHCKYGDWVHRLCRKGSSVPVPHKPCQGKLGSWILIMLFNVFWKRLTLVYEPASQGGNCITCASIEHWFNEILWCVLINLICIKVLLYINKVEVRLCWMPACLWVTVAESQSYWYSIQKQDCERLSHLWCTVRVCFVIMTGKFLSVITSEALLGYNRRLAFTDTTAISLQMKCVGKMLAVMMTDDVCWGQMRE